MKRKCWIFLLLCALLPALLTGAPAFAEDYPEGSVYQGLSGILPEDSLTLPADTEWATLTASWGLQVTFYDWDLTVLQTELIPEELLPGSTSAPADPVRSGYTFTGWERHDSNSGTAQLNDDGSVTDITGPGPIEFIAVYSPVYYVWLGKLAENLPYDTEDYNNQPFFTYDFTVSPVVYDGAAGGYVGACAPGDVITLKVAAYDSSGGEWADTGTEKTVTVNSSGHIELSLLPGEAVGFPLSSGVSGEQGFVVSERWVQEPCKKNQPAAQIYLHDAAAGADVREALSTLNYIETFPGEIFHASPYDPHYESVFSAGINQCLLSCREIPDGPTILQSAIIVNRYAPKHSLSVSKEVIGADTDELFSFEVTLKDENGDPVLLTPGTYTPSGSAAYTVAADGKITFSLKHGESVMIEGIFEGAVATVREIRHDGYSVTVKEGSTELSDTDKVEDLTVDSDRVIAFYNEPSVPELRYVWLGKLAKNAGNDSTPYIFYVQPSAATGYQPGDVIPLKTAVMDNSGIWQEQTGLKNVTVDASGQMEITLRAGEAVGFPVDSSVTDQFFTVLESFAGSSGDAPAVSAVRYLYAGSLTEGEQTMAYMLLHSSGTGLEPNITLSGDAQFTEPLLSYSVSSTGEALIRSSVVTNQYPLLCTLTVTKEVLGSATQTAFPFEMTLSDKNGAPVKLSAGTFGGVGGNAEYTVDADGKISFSLKHGESVFLEEIPEGTLVTLKETSHAGYSVYVKHESGAVLSSSDTVEDLEMDNSWIKIICYNSPGAELPQTGGPGRTLFAFSGLFLSAGAAMYGFLTRRRRERRSE